jgi:tape measure domain-containing protein
MSLVVPAVFKAIDRMTAPLQNMYGAVNSFASKTERRIRSVGTASESMYQSMTGGKAGYVMAAGLGAAAFGMKTMVQEAMKIEDAVANFTPILGGVEKATELVNRMNVAAAETPFEFENITKTVQTLLPVMNGDLDKTIATMKMLGDTAGGNAQKLDSITRGYTKAFLKGKVDMESLNMIGEAGVPIVAELAKSMGYGEKSMGAFFKKISAGEVTTKQLENVFKKMTSQGGMFFNAMSIASNTTSGRLSTMKDAINLSAAAIGTEMLPYIKDFIDRIIIAGEKVREWVKANKQLIGQKVKAFFDGLNKVINFLIDNFETIVTIAKIYIATLIVLKTVSIASAVATKVMTIAAFAYNVAIGIMAAVTGVASVAIGKNTVALYAYKIALGVVTAVQWLWNGAMTAFNFIVSMNPISLLVIAIAALVAGIVIAIKNFDTFGSVLLLLLGPIGVIVHMVMMIRKHWDDITSAFTNGGFIEGVKQIGIAILDFILYPIQQALSLIDKVAGTNFAASVKDLRAGMVSEAVMQQEAQANATPVVRNDVQRSENLQRSISEQRQNVTIDINDRENRANVFSDNNYSPVRLNSTLVR